MHRFFSEEAIIDNRTILTDETFHHIKNVIKLNVGEELVLVKNQKELLCRIDKIEKNSIIVYVQETLESSAENPYEITLFQGIPKRDKMDFIVEKAVEAGVHRIVPLRTARSIATITEKDIPKKQERFQRIARSAAQQCGRLVIPEVGAPCSIKQVDWDAYDLKLVCYEDEDKTTLKEVLSQAAHPRRIAVVIGPEGGLASEEISYLLGCGFFSVSLGRRILRTETAGLYALANINYCFS